MAGCELEDLPNVLFIKGVSLKREMLMFVKSEISTWNFLNVKQHVTIKHIHYNNLQMSHTLLR